MWLQRNTVSLDKCSKYHVAMQSGAINGSSSLSPSGVTENLFLTLARLAWKYICSDNTDVRGDPQDPGLSPQASQEGGGRGGG